MKKIALGIIIGMLLFVVNYHKVVTYGQMDRLTKVDQREQSHQAERSTEYIKTYKDETHKKIQYGKLSFSLDSYHIVSDTNGGNREIFKCKVDEEKIWGENYMTIIVREIDKEDFSNIEKIISYLSERMPQYEKIEIYNNINDDSGISSLYVVQKGRQTKYTICYKNVYYLMESDNYRAIDPCLFRDCPEVTYTVNNLKIACSDSFAVYVNKIVSFEDRKFKRAKYNIFQGKNGITHYAELSLDQRNQYHFTLKNEKDENLLTLSTHALYFNSVIGILDINRDGYADIQFLEEEGTVHNGYALYVWDELTKKFVKVKCDEPISNLEVYDGYLLNRIIEDVESGIEQKLVWDKNTLIKESEEYYHTY
jgi:hypothetical protein